MQDGLGAAHVDLAKVGNWFYQMKLAMFQARPKSQLWTDLETFMPNHSPTDFKPAPIERVIQQLAVENQYVQFKGFLCIIPY